MISNDFPESVVRRGTSQDFFSFTKFPGSSRLLIVKESPTLGVLSFKEE